MSLLLLFGGGAPSVTGTLAETLANATVAASGTAGVNYTYDFAGTNGDPWAGWTTVVGTVDIQSNKGRQLTAATAFAVAAARYDSPLPQNYELRVDTTITTVTAAEFYGAINTRAGSNTFSDMRQHSSWHLRFVGNATFGTAELYRIDNVGTSSAVLAGGADIDFVQGTVLHVRLLLSGSVFKARYWKDAQSEPSTWQIDFDDGVNAPTGTGLSLAVHAGNNASADDWRWDDLTVTNSAFGTLAETLGNVTSAAAGTYTPAAITGSLAETLENVTSATTGTYTPAGVAGTLAETLGAVATQALLIDDSADILDEDDDAILDEDGDELLVENPVPILDEDGDPLLDEGGAVGGVGAAGTLAETLSVTVAATGQFTAVTVTGTLAKTLGNVTSTTAGRAQVSGDLARTLQNATSAASGGSSNGGTVARTLANVVSQASGGVGVSGTVARTLANVTATSAGAADLVTGTLAKTLDAVETGAPLTDDLGDVVTDDAGNIVYVRGAEGLHGIGGTLAETLADITSTTAGSATSVVGSLAQTLEDATLVSDGVSGATGTLAETLADATSTTAGTVGVTGALTETLADTTSAADGTSTPPDSGVAGSVNVTLAAVTSAAAGNTVSGTVDTTLGDATSAADGTAGPVGVTGTLTVTLADVTSQTAGDSTVIGDLARTLSDLVGDGAGSSVAGTVEITLEDVTSTTTGSVTITVYAVGRIESVYQMGPIEAVFETGRVVAVAGSRV